MVLTTGSEALATELLTASIAVVSRWAAQREIRTVTDQVSGNRQKRHIDIGWPPERIGHPGLVSLRGTVIERGVIGHIRS